MEFSEDHKRKAIESFLDSTLKNSEKFYYMRHFVSIDQSDSDCIVIQLNQALQKAENKMLFHVTMHDSDYPNLTINQETFSYLKEICQPEEGMQAKIYHVHFLPKKTSTYDLLKLEAENKLTFVGDIAYMDVTDGKHFDFYYIPDQPTTFEAFPKETETEPGYISEEPDQPEAFPREEWQGDPDIAEHNIYHGDPVKGGTEKELKKTLSEAIAIASLTNQDQQQLPLTQEIQVSNTVKRNNNGEVFYTTLQEWEQMPPDLRWAAAHTLLVEGYLKTDKSMTKEKLLQTYGNISNVAAYLYEKLRIEFLGLDIENKYEIKVEEERSQNG